MGLSKSLKISRISIISSLTFLIPITLTISISVGYAKIGFVEAFMAIFGNVEGLDSVSRAIILEIRFPRACAALLAGAVLAISGSVVQGALRNALASPFTIGVSSGASFGAALIIVAGVSSSIYVMMLSAFAFALLAALVSLGIARLKGVTPQSLVLSGVAMMYLFSAGVTLLQYIAREWQLTELVYWTMGDLRRIDWGRFTFMLPAVFTCLPLFAYAWDLNTLMMGEEVAKSLGTNPRRVRTICTLLAALSTSIIVCSTGPIGFICLIAPHIARFLVGTDYRFSMVCSALIGGLLLLLADTTARVALMPIELPVGVVTAAMGVPFFVSLLLRTRKEIW
ncbi:MAG: iron ABC transporter permease [Candidatus Nezhaarchaeales archaeon]